MTNTTPESTTIKWTPPQWQAIVEHEHDLVVSASAGSGKTAVLTERVLRLVTELDPATGESPARIDELLIITFTEKAARQMRERIEKRLRQELMLKPDSHDLQRAYDGLASAWVMTIDAFCRRLVIEHFHQAGVSPSPRIPDQAEQHETELRVLSDLLEEWAGASGPEGPRRRDGLNGLLRCCGRGADELTGELRALMGFLQSLDQPEAWLRRVKGDLEGTLQAAEFSDLPEAVQAREGFQRSTGELGAALGELIELAGLRGGEAGVLDAWRELAVELKRWAHFPGSLQLDLMGQWLADAADEVLGKLDRQKVCGKVLYKDEEFKTIFLGRFAKHYTRWRAHWFPLDEAGLLLGARQAATQGLTMLQLAGDALRRLDQIKQRRGLLSFNDFERQSLRILLGADGHGPSEIALQYQQQFKYVLVDEYQDTSPLQDALVQLVSRASDPTPHAQGNLFLVGDYKQSIYRFRHAEPALFLDKFNSLKRINLHENFRSRPNILEFINHCFRRMMDAAVGDMDYGELEQLKSGRVEPAGVDPVCVEVNWLGTEDDTAGAGEDASAEDPTAEDAGAEDGQEALAGLEAQAHWVAKRIKELTDPQTGLMIPDDPAPGDPNPTLRRAMPGDCAILVRSIRSELGIWMEALEGAGLKVRSPGVNPLFSTSEMVDLINALRITDNPFQDIPLAALMRSPLARFTDDELLRIRMRHPRGAFHEAVWSAAGRPLPQPAPEADGAPPASAEEMPLPAELLDKLAEFLGRIDHWRTVARRQSPSELLSQILQDSGYEAYLMGHLDGLTRLENLGFLRGLLRRLGRSDEGSNPLAGFLEMIDRAEAEEGEVGELPETVASQLDAVNLLTVHRSKGLEYPIVFLPRLERRFRQRKISETLCDRTAGMARQGIDGERRRRYPTLAHRALMDELHRKDRSEEIRLLYVAMTRARERLILVGQMGRLDRLEQRWALVRALGGRSAGAMDRLYAVSPAELLGPIVEWLRCNPENGPVDWLSVNFNADRAVRPSTTDAWSRVRQTLQKMELSPDQDWQRVLRELEPNVGVADSPALAPELNELATSPHFLPTLDPGQALTTLPGKTTVTQLRRNGAKPASEGIPTDLPPPISPEMAEDDRREADRSFWETEMSRPYTVRRDSLTNRQPRWILASPTAATPKAASLTAARRGTLTHALLAKIDLRGRLDCEGLQTQVGRLIDLGLLGDPGEDKAQILACLDFAALDWFFATELGREISEHPGKVSRELSFTARKSLINFAPEAAAAFPTESIIVQGIVDAVIDDGNTACVLDYKTDRVRGPAHLAELVAHYRLQIEHYAHALEAIWQLRSVRSGLIFLDARQIIWLKEEND